MERSEGRIDQEEEIMRRYETTYILRPNLGDALITEVIERTNNIIKNDGGSIIWLEHWGVKKLAYEIKKESHGYYIFFDYAAPSTTVLEMERIFNIDDRVLRYLTVKLEDSIDEEDIAKASENAEALAAAKSAKGEEPEDEAEDDDDDDDDDENDDDESSDNDE